MLRSRGGVDEKSRSPARQEERLDLAPSRVPGPAERCAGVDPVGEVEARPARDQQLDHGRMAPERSVVQRRRMGMRARRIEAVGVLPGVEEEADERCVAELGGEGEGEVALGRGRSRKEARSLLEAAQARRGGEPDAGALAGERLGRVGEAKDECGEERRPPRLPAALERGAVVEQELGQFDLEAGLMGVAARDEQAQGRALASIEALAALHRPARLRPTNLAGLGRT